MLALSRFGFGRLEGLISSSSPFLAVQASIAAQHHLGNACRILREIHQGDHELFFHQWKFESARHHPAGTGPGCIHLPLKRSVGRDTVWYT